MTVTGRNIAERVSKALRDSDAVDGVLRRAYRAGWRPHGARDDAFGYARHTLRLLRTIFVLFAVATGLVGIACGLSLSGTGPSASDDAALVDGGTDDVGMDSAGDAASDACERGSMCGATVVQLVAGGQHYCVRTSAGEIYCWGRNDNGELGLGDTVARARPTRVAVQSDGGALPPMDEVGAGALHTCARAFDDSVYCWGQNLFGQLGQGLALTQSNAPVRINALFAGHVAAGGYHSCAIDHALRVQCWGRNEDSELGYLPGLRADAGEARCAASTAWCNPTPTAAGLAEQPVKLGLSQQSSCAVIVGGGVKCWGVNVHGELGVTPSASTPNPVSVSVGDGGLLMGATSVSGLSLSVCATVQDAGARCWGYGSFGNLGNGVSTLIAPPQTFGALTDVSGVAPGLAHTCVAAAGRVHCVGWNGEGALGNGVVGGDAGCPTFANGQQADQCVLTIVDVGLTFVAEVAATATSTCVRTQTGKLLCWGENFYGELGHPPGKNGDVACRGSQGTGTSQCNPLPTEVVFGP